MEVGQTGGQAGESLNVPSARRQDGVVAMTSPVPEGRTEKIGVALRPMRRYVQHCCTFALRLRDDILADVS
jgi:hypothetical protein